MAVSKRLRYEILRRDNHACRYCGGTAPEVPLTVDHVVPVALGGTDKPANLVTACRDCNSGKSATPPGAPLVDQVNDDALRWAAAMASAAEFHRRESAAMELHREYVYDVWVSHYGDSDDLPKNFGPSVDDWIAAGLGYGDFEYAAEVTAQRLRRDPWRYFCGICWNRVSALHEVARALIDADGDGA